MMLERLDEIPWDSLELLNEDKAAEMPTAIRRLLDPTAEIPHDYFQLVASPINGVSDGAAAVVPFMFELLGNPVTPHRSFCMAFLVDVLQATLPDEQEWLEPTRTHRKRARAAVHLGRLALLQAIADRDPDVRREATRLNYFFPEERDAITAQNLLRLELETEPTVKLALIEALSQNASGVIPLSVRLNQIATNPADDGAVRVLACCHLFRAVEDSHQTLEVLELAVEAAITSSTIAYPRWFPAILETLYGRPMLLMPLLDRLLNHTDNRVRDFALQRASEGFGWGFFGVLATESAYTDWLVGVVRQLLMVDDVSLRDRAIRTLQLATQRGPNDPIKAMPILALEPQIVEHLQPEKVSVAAILTAGYLGLASSVPALAVLLDESDPQTVKLALQSLQYIGSDASLAARKISNLEQKIKSESAKEFAEYPGLVWQLGETLKALS